MHDFNINYDKLKRLNIIKFHRLIYLLIIIIGVLIFLACHISIDRKIKTLGIMENDVLKIVINENLSDKIKNNSRLIFNNKTMNYQIVGFGEYEINDKNIYEHIDLIVDRYVYQNEVGEVTIIYAREKIINYILDLFK